MKMFPRMLFAVSALLLPLRAFAGEDGEAARPEPVARVEVAKVEQRSLSDTIVAYGKVAASAAGARQLTVPFECRVRRVLVVPGQPVKAGQELLEVGPSPAAAVAVNLTAEQPPSEGQAADANPVGTGIPRHGVHAGVGCAGARAGRAAREILRPHRQLPCHLRGAAPPPRP